MVFEGHITDHNPLVRQNLLNAVTPIQRIVIKARLKRIGASFAEIIAMTMLDGSARPVELEGIEHLIMGTIFTASQWRLSATPLQRAWQPRAEPISASAAHFEPLFNGLSVRTRTNSN